MGESDGVVEYRSRLFLWSGIFGDAEKIGMVRAGVVLEFSTMLACMCASSGHPAS
jgi:hypothetical protein